MKGDIQLANLVMSPLWQAAGVIIIIGLIGYSMFNLFFEIEYSESEGK